MFPESHCGAPRPLLNACHVFACPLLVLAFCILGGSLLLQLNTTQLHNFSVPDPISAGLFSPTPPGSQSPCPHPFSTLSVQAFLCLIGHALGSDGLGRAGPPPPPPEQEGAVAVCLAGGLRTFELTAQSLAQHLFAAYAPADVFISAPVDENSHKLLLLLRLAEDDVPGLHSSPAGPGYAQGLVRRSRHPAELGAGSQTGVLGWRLKGIQFVVQQPLDEATGRASFLHGWTSRNGVQRLLQYFELVEGCIEPIKAAEKHQGSPYAWIVRTRPDAFWAGPAPPVASLNRSAYNYPAGTSWGGLNDRFGAATHDMALAAMRRLNVVDELARAGTQFKGRSRNSEGTLRLHLELKGIPCNPTSVPFCVLSFRKYAWPLTPSSVPVFAISSTAALNGAKCKPCSPAVTGPEARDIVCSLMGDRGLPLPDNVSVPAAGYELCNVTDAWPMGWESAFDARAGPGGAVLRTKLATMSWQQCVDWLRRTLQSVPFYAGPTAGALCHARHLGEAFKVLTFRTTSKVGRVMSVLRKANKRTPNYVLFKRFLSLAKWSPKTLPLPPGKATKGCKPCHLVVRLQGSKGNMGRKEKVAQAMKKHGWELLKCGGKHTDQICLFLHG